MMLHELDLLLDPSRIFEASSTLLQRTIHTIWDRLTKFVDDARIPLDNNATERAIRGPVVGRKNHYGSKSRSGTFVAATVYSLVESAKLASVNPAAYLHAAVLAAREGATLTPAQFAARPR